MMRKVEIPEDILEDILSVVDGSIPKCIMKPFRAQISDSLVRSFRHQLSKSKVYLVPEVLEKIKSYIATTIETSFVTPGDFVGILASQTLESLTQQTLNVFHSAGISEKNVTLGFPRFEEIIGATKTPKTVCFVFYPLDVSIRRPYDIEHLGAYYAPGLLDVRLHSLVRRYSVTRERFVHQNVLEKIQLDLLGVNTNDYDVRIRFEIDLDRMFSSYVDVDEIASRINEVYNTRDVVCVFGTTRDAYFDVYVSSASFLEAGGDLETLETYFIECLVPQILKDVSIKGVEGITSVVPCNLDENGVPEAFEGNGGTLIDLFSHPNCDTTRTFNDNLWDVYKTLGVEATRTVLIRELIKIVSFDGTYVNQKHISLLIDMMLVDGTINPANRYGMVSEHFSPIAKASFEETVDNLLRSGISEEIDSTKGVNSALVLGKLPFGGTNTDFKLLSTQHTVDEFPDAEFDEDDEHTDHVLV